MKLNKPIAIGYANYVNHLTTSQLEDALQTLNNDTEYYSDNLFPFEVQEKQEDIKVIQIELNRRKL